MRITQRAVALTSLQGLNRNLDAVGKLQQQLTSGRLINAPSDSPTGTNRAMQTRGEQAAVAQQARNISDAKSWLEQARLHPAGDARHDAPGPRPHRPGAQHRRRRPRPARRRSPPRSTRCGRACSAWPTPRSRGVRSSAASPPAARPTTPTGTCVGSAGAPVTRRVSDSETVRVDVTGPEAFGADGTNLFAIVERHRRRTSSTATRRPRRATSPTSTRVMKKMMTAVADVGSRAARVERAEQLNFDRSLTLESAAGRDREHRPAEHDHEAADAAGRATRPRWRRRPRPSQPTLLDYLR